ncbi:hypothetical protein NN4_54600 [Nocardia ninae NBRC 108245]|uniref:Uncharacterized protein n=1 Tax=Nocardia ninae NBRC 108245 TaxID=1210091 RepID=A0A511MKH3_9NOCA|nr:hypothetical protein NN4_54600 [Nocardia ninae NBRC 108245]
MRRSEAPAMVPPRPITATRCAVPVDTGSAELTPIPAPATVPARARAAATFETVGMRLTL